MKPEQTPGKERHHVKLLTSGIKSSVAGMTRVDPKPTEGPAVKKKNLLLCFPQNQNESHALRRLRQKDHHEVNETSLGYISRPCHTHRN